MLGSHKSDEALESSIQTHTDERRALNGHSATSSAGPPHHKMRDINENVKSQPSNSKTDLTCQEMMDVSHSDMNDDQDLTCNESVANDSAEFDFHTRQGGRRADSDNNKLVIDLESNVNQNNNKIDTTPAILRAVSLASHSMITMPTMVPPNSTMRKDPPVVTPPASSMQKLTKKGTVPVREAVDPAKYVRLQDVDGVRYACSKCGNVYKWRKSLNKHWKEKHDGEIPVPASGNFSVLNIPHLKGAQTYSTPKSSSTMGRTIISPSMLTPMGTISSTHLDKYVIDRGAQSGGRPIQSSHHATPPSSSVLTPSTYSSHDIFTKTDRFDSLFRMNMAYKTADPTIHSPFFPLPATGMRLKTDIAPPAPLQNPQPRFLGFDKYSFDYMSKEKPAHVPLPPPAAHSHGLMKQHEIQDDDSSDSLPLDLSKKGKPSNALDLSGPSGGKPAIPSDAPLDFSIKSAPGSERSTPVASLKDRDDFMDSSWMRSTSTPDSEAYQNLQCYKCPFVAKDKQGFEEHLEQHTRGQYPQCGQCKEHFSSNEELTQHFGLHHLHILNNIEQYDEEPSHLKNASSPEQRQLFQYLARPRDPTIERKCVVCGAKFPHLHDISRHFTHFHADLPNPYKKRPNDEDEDENEPWAKMAKFDKPYTNAEGDLECEQCTFIARDPAEMSRHLLVHSFNRPHACTMCGFSSKSKEELSNHVWKYHPTHAEELALMSTNGGATPVSASKNLNMNTDKSPNGNNTADTSGSSVNSGEFGLDDVIIVTPNTTEVPLVRGRKSGKSGTTSSAEILLPYKCSVCEYRARWPSEITQHMKNHSDEKPFHCPRCTYKSKWKWDVVKHLKRCGGGTVKDVIDTSRVHSKSDGDSSSPPSQHVVKQLQFVNSSPKHSMLSNGPPNVTIVPGSSPRIAGSMERNVMPTRMYSPTAVDFAQSRGAPSPANSTSSDQSSIRNPSSPGGSGKSKSGFNQGLVSQGIYHCTQCPFVGNSPAELKRHCRVHSDEKPFTCATCGYSSKWKCDLKKHIRTYEHVAAPRREGSDSKQTGESLRFMTSNMDDDLSSYSDDDVSYLDQRALSPEELPTPRPTLYKCDKCQYVTYKKNMLDGHMKIHRQSKEKSGKLKCKQCDFEAPDLSSFLQHKLTHSSQQIVETTEDNNGKQQDLVIKRYENNGSPVRNRRKAVKLMSCSKCPYTCSKYAKMEIHEMMHEPHDYESFFCEFCDYNVRNRALLIQHMKLHCEFDEWYNNNADTLNGDLLQQAEVIEIDEAEFMESQGDKAHDFILKISSQSGRNLNIGNQLGFCCPKCPFTTDSKSSFENHSQHHGLGEKFTCEHCDWSADKLHLLYKHVREVHPQELTLSDSSNNSAEDVVENRTESSRTARKKQRKPKTCGKCGYMTDNLAKMTQHLMKHENNESLHCHYCDASIHSSTDMLDHLLKVHNVKIDDNAMMGSASYRDTSLARESLPMKLLQSSDMSDMNNSSDHPATKQLTEIKGQPVFLLQYGNRKVFACTKCSYRTNNSMHCMTHSQHHGSDKQYTCDYCDFSLDKLTHIFHHIKTCHSNEIDSTDTEAEGPLKSSSDNTVHRSPKSVLRKRNSPSYHYQMRNKSVNGSVKLPRTKLRNNGLTRSHLANVKKSKNRIRKNRVSPVQRVFRCKVCNYTASKQFLLHQHMQFHANLIKIRDPASSGDGLLHNLKECRYKCVECPFSSNKRHELRKHKALHVATQKYKCDFCTYSVNRMNVLEKHIKLHREMRAAPSLQNHDKNLNATFQAKYKIVLKPIAVKSVVKVERENNDKVYKCGECPYGSNKHQSYANHVKLHGAEGRYPCDKCTYVVDRQNLLNQHTKLHNNREASTCAPRNRYKCAKCPYHTHRENTLQLHEELHGRVRLACPYCDYITLKAAQLGAHIRLHLPGAELATAVNKSSHDAEGKLHLIRGSGLDNNNREVLREAICQYCEKNFNSETEKKLHESQQHLVEAAE